MLNAYHPEAWHELFVVLGGAIAALTGLLFVATSLHVEKIREAVHWRRRAFTNTFALVGALIESMLVLFPQPASWLAYELIALNAALFVFLMLPLIRSWLREVSGLPPLRLFAGAGAWLLGVAGGAGLLVQTGGGMFLVAASCLVLIWVCVWNAWSLLMGDYKG